MRVREGDTFVLDEARIDRFIRRSILSGDIIAVAPSAQKEISK